MFGLSNEKFLAEELNFTGENICPKCFGSGMEVVPGKGAKPCQCRKRRSLTKLIEDARIPSRYENCHFQNFEPQNAAQNQVLRLAVKFAMEYPATKTGLLVTGTCGVGKTHLTVSILKALAERGFRCLFYDFNVFLKKIRDPYHHHLVTSENRLLANFFAAEILALDDLGASKPTDWLQDMVGHIIETRHRQNKLTIFTTNYLDEKKTAEDEILANRIGFRMRSRLREICKTVHLTGSDYRQKK